MYFGRYICLWTKRFFELYFSHQLTFSNIRGRTSRQIYRLALPLLSPEKFSSSSNQGFSYIMCTLLMSGWMNNYPHKIVI